jgi:hypothetical protein
VKTTSVSGAESVDIGPKNVRNSTVPLSKPSHMQQLDHPIGENRKRKYEEIVETVACDVREQSMADGHDDIVEVSQFLPEFSCLKGETSSNSATVQVKGRLKAHVDFWVKIQAPHFIIQSIIEGYKIPFYETPKRAYFGNNNSSTAHKTFVTQSIQELLSSGRVVQTTEDHLHVISPLSVAINKDKKRLILDLRYVNQHIYKQKIKFEDWRTAMSYFGKGTFFTKFDLKSGYHHLDIFPEHQRFLGFSWPSSSGETCFYMFTVLPFGLSSAPYIFTKLIRPLTQHWRAQAIHITIFLDDGVDIEDSLQTAQEHAATVRHDLAASGFVPNDQKSVWKPTPIICWLGLQWNGVLGTIAISPTRIATLLTDLNAILNTARVSARTLARVVGRIISTGPVTGNLARIMSRHCQMSIASRDSWDIPSVLDQYSLLELKFWQENIEAHNTRICNQFRARNRVVSSDASNHACAALLLDSEHVAHRMFTAEEAVTSSCYRELLAIQFGIASFAPLLKGCSVKWLTDSQSAMKIAQVGSMRFDCHKLAIDIFSMCLNAGIQLDIQWIPRTQNAQADYISKLIDFDDWELTQATFQQLEVRFGPHTLDCFASYRTAKVKKFFSRYWNPGTAGVDAFYQDWSNENCLVVPPVPIAARVLNFMYHNKWKGTLVVPLWTSASYWPLIVSKFASYVKGKLVLQGNLALRQGTNSKCLLGSTAWMGNVLACKFDFSTNIRAY